MHQAASMEIRLLKFFNWIHLHSMISLLELSITLTSILHCFRFNGSCMKVVFGTRQHHRISKLAMPWRLAQGWVTFRIWTIVHCVESNRMCSDYLCCQRIAISISVRKYSLVKVRRIKVCRKEICFQRRLFVNGRKYVSGRCLRFLAISGPTCQRHLARVYSVIELFCLWIKFTICFMCIMASVHCFSQELLCWTHQYSNQTLSELCVGNSLIEAIGNILV